MANEPIRAKKPFNILILTLLLMLSTLCALFLTEVFVRYGLNYPTLGVKNYIVGLDITTPKNSRIYQPYAGMWSVEGGNIVTKKNNLGLTGADISVSKDSKYIYLMGTSFIEAAETPADKTASSHLTHALQNLDQSYQVLDIAYRNNDPYAQFYRLLYFQKQFKPYGGIIVVDNIYNDKAWKNRYGTKLSFDPKPGQFNIDSRPKTELIRIIRNTSSFMNLFIHLLTSEPTNQETGKKTKHTPTNEYNYSWQVYEQVLYHINQLLSGKLIVVDISNDNGLSAHLMQICNKLNIRYEHEHLLSPDNQIGGAVHLNLEGNRKLGELLFSTYRSYLVDMDNRK